MSGYRAVARPGGSRGLQLQAPETIPSKKRASAPGHVLAFASEIGPGFSLGNPIPSKKRASAPGTVHLEPRTLNLEPLKTLSSPSTPKNPHNPHRTNHFPPKNSWHTSYAPLDTINIWIKSIEGQLRPCGNRPPPPARTALSQPNKPHRINILAATPRE